MNVKKMRRCKRALERVIANIGQYQAGNLPLNITVRFKDALAHCDDPKEIISVKLERAIAHRDALIARGVS